MYHPRRKPRGLYLLRGWRPDALEISELLSEDSGHRNDVGVVVLWEEWRSRRRRKMEEKHGQTKMSLARNSVPMSFSLLCVATKIMSEVGNKLQVNAGYGRRFPGLRFIFPGARFLAGTAWDGFQGAGRYFQALKNRPSKWSLVIYSIILLLILVCLQAPLILYASLMLMPYITRVPPLFFSPLARVHIQWQMYIENLSCPVGLTSMVALNEGMSFGYWKDRVP